MITMNRKASINAFLWIVILMLLLNSCSGRYSSEEDTLYTGERFTPDKIDSIFDALSEEITEKYPIDTYYDGRVIVYWLEGGSVWHLSRSCSNLQNAEPGTILSGDVYEALKAGKERGCKNCAKDSDITAHITDSQTEQPSSPETAERYPKEYDSAGELIVYWLEGGSVWHESAKCGTVTKADPAKLLRGTPQDAFAAGKDRACKVCSADSEITVFVPETTIIPETTWTPTTTIPESIGADNRDIVYWTDSGSVWHISIDCSALARTDPENIRTGDVSKAIEAEKERACKKCSG